jgi:hypothetical protein
VKLVGTLSSEVTVSNVELFYVLTF